MTEPYLILHKVYGEPAFDIAVQIEIPDRYPIWIIPTSGHAAFPADFWKLSDLLNNTDSLLNVDLSGIRDHYVAEEIKARKDIPPSSPRGPKPRTLRDLIR